MTVPNRAKPCQTVHNDVYRRAKPCQTVPNRANLLSQSSARILRFRVTLAHFTSTLTITPSRPIGFLIWVRRYQRKLSNPTLYCLHILDVLCSNWDFCLSCLKLMLIVIHAHRGWDPRWFEAHQLHHFSCCQRWLAGFPDYEILPHHIGCWMDWLWFAILAILIARSWPAWVVMLRIMSWSSAAWPDFIKSSTIGRTSGPVIFAKWFKLSANGSPSIADLNPSCALRALWVSSRRKWATNRLISDKEA